MFEAKDLNLLFHGSTGNTIDDHLEFQSLYETYTHMHLADESIDDNCPFHFNDKRGRHQLKH